MKKIIALLTLSYAMAATILPSFALAGPEDHTPGAVYAATSVVPYYLQELVFDSANLSADESTLILTARYGNFGHTLQVIELNPYKDGMLQLTAQKEILNRWSKNCGEGERATATVRAVANAYMVIDPKRLEITVEYSTTTNTCGGAITKQTIHYELAE